MKRSTLTRAPLGALLALACVALAALASCNPGGNESASCPPQGSTVVSKQKLCDADCVIYKTQAGSLFLCAGSNNHELSGIAFDTAKCVDNQIVVETRTAGGSKYRDTFDKDGKFIKSEQIP